MQCPIAGHANVILQNALRNLARVRVRVGIKVRVRSSLSQKCANCACAMIAKLRSSLQIARIDKLRATQRLQCVLGCVVL